MLAIIQDLIKKKRTGNDRCLFRRDVRLSLIGVTVLHGKASVIRRVKGSQRAVYGKHQRTLGF